MDNHSLNKPLSSIYLLDQQYDRTGIAYADHKDVPCPGLEAFTWTRGSKEWQKSCIQHQTVASRDSKPLSEIESADVAVLISPHYDVYCFECKNYPRSSFDFIPQWWEPAIIDSNGAFYHIDEYDREGKLVAKGTWVKFLIHHISHHDDPEKEPKHNWEHIVMFTHWDKVSNRTRIYFIDTDAQFVARILTAMLATLQQTGSPPHDPLWMYPVVLTDYLNLQHIATYAIRDLVRFEQKKAEPERKAAEAIETARTRVDYARMHKIAQFAMVVCEVLQVNIKTMEYIVACHEDFMKQRAEQMLMTEMDSAATVHKIHQQFRTFAHVVFSTHCRCLSYLGSLQNEIQLVFNVVSQDEARASVAIARATKSDNEIMKTTSFIALVFLPPTFISAIFSTSFFSFGDDERGWQVSNKFWWYWVIVVPATLLCLLVWYKVFFRRAPIYGLDPTMGPEADVELNNLRKQDGLV